MRRLIILGALALVLGAVVLRLLQYDTGYVLIVVGGKSVEMRFWAAAILLVLIFAVVALVWKYLMRTVRLTKGTWYSLRHDRALRAQHRLDSGVLNLLEGDYKTADFMLSKALKKMPHNRLAAVAACESALRLNRPEAARARVNHLGELKGEKGISIELAKVHILMYEQHWQEARQRLLVLKTRSPRHPVVIQRLTDVLEAVQDWPALESLLLENDRSDVMSESAWQALRERTYRQLLLQAGGAEEPLAEVQDVWKRTPKALREEPSVLAVYGRLMLGLNQTADLEPMLRHGIRRRWHDELVELYGLLPAPDPMYQLKQAEKWLEPHPRNLALLLALGRISLRNELWGKAKEYFSECLRLAPSPVVYAELARLLSQLGEHKQSEELYRQGLLASASSLPNLSPRTSTPSPYSG